MWLIVGLGNPGEEYRNTRHNIGFRCVDEIAARYGMTFSDRRSKALVAQGTIAGQRVALAKPQTYMNASGESVVGLKQWYKIAPEDELLVIYDDLDLPFGVLRLRARGSAGTHNGMRSIVGLLGSQNFPRLRVGIDPVPPHWDAARYVLSRFNNDEEAQIADLCGRVAQAVEQIVRDGVTSAMNQINAPEAKKKSAAPDQQP
ncbi:MAG: aminoacyl-tRNA hydrolase [Roseiflexaceae bacterium]